MSSVTPIIPPERAGVHNPIPCPCPNSRYRSRVARTCRLCSPSGGWLERLRTTRLYRYLMPEATFVDIHDHGVHVSRAAVLPLRVDPVGDLLAALAGADVEVRIAPSLVPLGRAISQTTLHFSLIRMRNAAGWTDRAGG
jgi:hypothetical protein